MLLNLSVRNRMSLASNALLTGWNLAIKTEKKKPFNILVHFFDIAAFFILYIYICFSPLTSLVLGTQKHCSNSDSPV